MQGLSGSSRDPRRVGLTEGLTNRYLQAANLAVIASRFRFVNRELDKEEPPQGLHGRLEELLVFEILKDGGTEYHRFTVRTLHKYVLSALKNKAVTGGKGNIDYSTMDLFSGRQATTTSNQRIPQQPLNYSQRSLNPLSTGPTSSSSTKLGRDSLMSIYESEVLPEPTTSPINNNSNNTNNNNNNNNNIVENRENVTYRERLGGYLHPRDMRRLVNPFSASNESEVIVRRHAILMNFDPLRAIVLKDRLLVLVPDGADSILVQLEKRLRGGGSETEEKDKDSETEDDIVTTPIVGSSSDTNNEQQKPIIIPEGGEGAPATTTSETETDDSTTDNVKGQVNDDDDDDDDDDDENENVSDLNADDGDDNFDTAAQDILDAFVEKEWSELEGRDWIDLPFELQCVDAVLSCVSQILAEDVHDLQSEANSMIVELLEPGSDVGDHSQEVLRQMKNSVQEMMSRVDGYCRAMELLLEDDVDMALMNLSRLLTHPERFIQPVRQAILDEESDEPELIVEAHLQRGHTLANALRLVQGQVTSTEDYAERKSDTIRNQLLYINLLLQTMSLSVALGSFVGAIFGMNVLNGYEDSNRAFILIFSCTVALVVCLPFGVILIIRKMGVLPGKI